MSKNAKEIRVISTAKEGKPNPFKHDVLYTDEGQWKYPGQVTKIPDRNITMKGVNYPILGVDDLGNEQMMYPNMDYTFPGQTVTEYPQMQKGGAPTMSDSLALYKNAKAVEDYYNRKNYQKTSSNNIDPESWPRYLKYLEEDVKSKQGYTDRGMETTTSKGRMVLPMSEYYKPTNNSNQFYQRESANAILDLNAPMSFYDKRIAPQYSKYYDNIQAVKNLETHPYKKAIGMLQDAFSKMNPNKRRDSKIGEMLNEYSYDKVLGNPTFGDAVTLVGYDPLAVKPYNMLTEAEKAERLKKYGRSGFPAEAKTQVITRDEPKKVVTKPKVIKKVTEAPVKVKDLPGKTEGSFNYDKPFVESPRTVQQEMTERTKEVPKTDTTKRHVDFSSPYGPVMKYYDEAGNVVKTEPYVAQRQDGGGWLDDDDFRQGGPITLPYLRKQARRKGTSKNIQSSINKIFTRNHDLFGPSGRNIYNPKSKYQTGGGWLDNLTEI